MSDVSDRKRALRGEMRALRRSLPGAARRSELIWASVTSIPAVVAARTVMAFASVPGEPDTTAFIAWCRAAGKTVMVPASDRDAESPADAGRFDVVIVPGVAFTPAGDRLGQGGGWYDRLLGEVRSDCVTIGVAFAPLVVDELPTEPHDVRVDRVVTDEGPAGGSDQTSS